MNFKLVPTRYKTRPATPWKVDIPATVAGKRTRRFFETEAEAKEWIDVFFGKVKHGGIKAAIDPTKPSFGRVACQYLEAKGASGAGIHAQKIRQFVLLWEKEFGSRPVDSIEIVDVERFVNRPAWGTRTRWNALGYLSAFFEWAKRRKFVTDNPAAVLRTETSKPDAPKEILSPFEMGLLLRLTRRDPIMRTFLVFSAFAGLRSIEIMRLDWSAVDWEEMEIHVAPGVIKKTRGVRQRYVRMRPLFLAFCPRGSGGKVIPCAASPFQRRLDRLRERMRKVLLRIKSPLAERWKDWPHNCGRHSFASYLLAEKEDAGYVAHQLGHTSPAMVHQAYAREVKRREVEEWSRLGELRLSVGFRANGL
jgi:integrase